MISFAKPEEDGMYRGSYYLIYRPLVQCAAFSDLFRALSEAVAIVSKGQHDPVEAHRRVKNFYNWADVAERTEVVYDAVVKSEQKDLWTRMQRYFVLRLPRQMFG